jgi:hypothetical protein
VRVVLAVAVVAAVAGWAQPTRGEAARPPTLKERTAIALAAVLGLPDTEMQSAFLLVRRVRVSTVRPGGSSSFVRFATAAGIARDQSGLYPTGPRTVLVALHRRTRRWTAIDFGISLVGCAKPQSYFGGRRAAILRDLGIRCA